MKEKKMLIDINETPSIGKWIILSLQHVFAMFGATILVSILVNSAAGETVLTIFFVPKVDHPFILVVPLRLLHL